MLMMTMTMTMMMMIMMMMGNLLKCFSLECQEVTAARLNDNEDGDNEDVDNNNGDDEDDDDDDDDHVDEEPFKVFQFGVLGSYCWWIRERSKHLAKAGEEEADISKVRVRRREG